MVVLGHACSRRAALGSLVACFDKMYTRDYAIYNIKQGVGELFDAKKIIVATNGFVKKQQKTPRSEILVAMQRRDEYFNRKMGL